MAHFFAHQMSLLRVYYVMWGSINQFPILPSLFPLFLLSESTGSGGMGPCAPLIYASDSGVARICERGAKARKQSDQAGGGCGWGCPPSHCIGRIFIINLNCVSKPHSLHINSIIRGRLCNGIDQFLCFFHSSIKGGGGGDPLVPPPYLRQWIRQSH